MSKALLLGLAALGCGQALAAAPVADPLANLDRYDVVWDSPSQDAHGSMPLGNGDIGVNAWVEPSGDLIFYISKTDAWDENDRLCKIGRVRVQFDPPLATTNGFRQELKLREGVIQIESRIPNSEFRIRLWVDADQPVVRVEAEAAAPVHCRATVELWRRRERPLGDQDDSHSGGGLSAQPFKPVVLPDVVVTSAAPRVVWYHRNTRSLYPDTLRNQHLETLQDKFTDPLLHHTFGASLRGEDMVADGPLALKSSAPAQRHRLSICVLAERAVTPETWLQHLDGVERTALKPGVESARRTTAAWWREFWGRSWIFVECGGTLPLPVNAHPWRVGVDSEGGSRFGGTVASPRVIGRAMSADEITQLAGQAPAKAQLAEEPLATGCTVAAWIKPAAGEAGRILDKGTAGRADGLTFDTHPGLSLRWIVGDHTMVHPAGLKPDVWQHVAATADANTGVRRIYLNGQLVKEERDGAPADILTRGYVLQRFMNACSGRGGSPIKFNGSIFTVENHSGASPETPDGDPDWRQWGGNYWFQNTRLAYWPMLATGDFDILQPWFRMYLDALPLGVARVQTYYKFAHAAVFPETMYFWGLPNNGDYGWGNTAPEPANGYIKRYWNGSLELIAVMLDRYDFTQDQDFARTTLVPLADPLIAFLDQYWQKRDANGKIVFDPAQSLETWHVAVNPMPEIAGLRFLLPRLLALPAAVTTATQRQRWERLLGELPPIPVREVNGRRLLQPAETFSSCANSENPELYAVFPYRVFGVGRADLALARDTYAARNNRHNHGWCQDSIQAACLGLGDEAGRQVTARATQINGAYRFPVMWGPNFDWIPDQDHGNNILTTLQFMLLQHDGDRLFLLPAWPPEWEVDFKLHAPQQTMVEGRYRNGRIADLKVTPRSRAKDIVDMSKP